MSEENGTERYGNRPGENGKMAMPKTITLGNILTMATMTLGGLSVATGLLWSAASWKEHTDSRMNAVDFRLTNVERSVDKVGDHLDFIDRKLGGPTLAK